MAEQATNTIDNDKKEIDFEEALAKGKPIENYLSNIAMEEECESEPEAPLPPLEVHFRKREANLRRMMRKREARSIYDGADVDHFYQKKIIHDEGFYNKHYHQDQKE